MHPAKKMRTEESPEAARHTAMDGNGTVGAGSCAG